MAHRTQMTLTDQQYARLVALSRDSGLSMSELVRRALERTYGPAGRQALASSFGAWRRRGLTGHGYVEGLRPGLTGRLEGAGRRPG